MNVAGGCLIVAFIESANDQAAQEFQREVFETSIRHETEGVIFDVSEVSLMDSFMSRSLVDICRTGLILGKKTVVVGLKPAVVASLVDLEIDLSSIRPAVNIEEAIALIRPPQVDTDLFEAKDTLLDEDVEPEEEDEEEDEEEVREIEEDHSE